jgi:hypothetical protein
MAYPDYIMKEAKEVVARWTKEGCLDKHKRVVAFKRAKQNYLRKEVDIY